MLLCVKLTGKGKELVHGVCKRSFKRSWWEMGWLERNLIKGLKTTATDGKFDEGWRGRAGGSCPRGFEGTFSAKKLPPNPP